MSPLDWASVSGPILLGAGHQMAQIQVKYGEKSR